MNGNEYSRPNSFNVKSPGNLPMPSFFIHGKEADRIINAMNVVRTQRIMAS